MPLWTILIATTSDRRVQRAALLDRLLPQVDAAGGLVTVELLWNHGEHTIAWLRQQLLMSATAQYVCFVDDDDMVSPGYVAEILARLKHGPDVVGFQLSVSYKQGALMILSPAYCGWYNDDSGMYRDITHLNPIRCELARAGNYTGAPEDQQRHGEDRFWADQIRPLLDGCRYEHIDVVLYHYLVRGLGTTRERTPAEQRALARTDPPPLPSPHASWHPQSSFAPPWRVRR